jgi:TonB family protein
MKKLAVLFSIISFLFCIHANVFAQSKTKSKKTKIARRKTVKPIIQAKTKPCVEEKEDPTATYVGSGKLDEKPKFVKKPCSLTGAVVKLKIISKPVPAYTQAARDSDVSGTIYLRVEFLASGAIGKVSPLNSLPYGLTEQAVNAARKIKFEPQTIGGVAVTIVKAVEYSFTIY